MSFSAWNCRILNYFFGEFARDRHVRLAVTQELLDQEFDDLGGSVEFLRAVRSGPEWPVWHEGAGWWGRPRDFFGRCLGLFRQWSDKFPRHEEYVPVPNDGPPYLPYLCALSYAWTLEDDDIGPNAYFKRIDRIYPNHGLDSDALSNLRPLWNGLEAWTQQADGILGRFVVETLGGKPHVGIPKSQVVFTARKINNLPLYFASLGLSPDSATNDEQLRHSVLGNEDLTRRLLGNEICNEIFDGSEIGGFAVGVLKEYLDEWDGDVPETELSVGHIVAGGEGTGSPALLAGHVVLALRPEDDNERWQALVYLRKDDLPDGRIAFTQEAGECVFDFTDSLGGPTGDGESLNISSLVTPTSDELLDGTWFGEGAGEKSVRFRPLPRRIRALQWHRDILLEDRSIPREGNSFFLVHEAVGANWDTWCRDLPANVSVSSEFPQQGIPTGWTLFHVSGLSAIGDGFWEKFPDGIPAGELAIRKRAKVLRFIGGSRVRRTAVRKTYLPYDPPKLILEAEGAVEVIADGASLVMIDSENVKLPAWIRAGLNPTSRTYKVEPNKDVFLVSVSANREGTEIGRVGFAMLRDINEIVIREEVDFSVDSEGEIVAGVAGAIGTRVPGSENNWNYADGTWAAWGITQPNLEHPGIKFLEWLSLKGRVTYVTARDFIRDTLGVALTSGQVKSLCHLGHLEIQRDSRGRWSHLYAAPFSLYRLPLNNKGSWQVVVGGTYNRHHLERTINLALEVGLEVDVHPQIGNWYPLIPPRVCIRGNDPGHFTQLTEATGLELDRVPPAWRFAQWAESLDDWLDGIEGNWYSGTIEHAEASYQPREFRTCENLGWPEDQHFQLVRYIDPDTRQHDRYVLLHREGSDYHHVYVRQREWGRWTVHRDAMDCLFQKIPDPPTYFPVAYEPAQQMVVLPIELEPPLLLARAFVLCSGLAPTVLTAEEYPAYRTNDNGFAPGPRHEGKCLAYKHVPREVACEVLNKFGAEPREYPTLPIQGKAPEFH